MVSVLCFKCTRCRVRVLHTNSTMQYNVHTEVIGVSHLQQCGPAAEQYVREATMIEACTSRPGPVAKPLKHNASCANSRRLPFGSPGSFLRSWHYRNAYMIRVSVPMHMQYHTIPEDAPKSQTRVFVWIGDQLTDLLELLAPADLHVQSKGWLAVLFVVACHGTGVVANPSDMVAESSARRSLRNQRLIRWQCPGQLVHSVTIARFLIFPSGSKGVFS
jgi:hypothetical protein